LLQTADGPLLIDTGIGHLGRPPYAVVGRVQEDLGSAGVSPGDIRHVIHTHLHADHAGGACRPDGEAQFRNAVHHVHPADWSFFARSTDRQDFEGRTAMTMLENQGRLDLRPDDHEVVTGVRVIHTPGHTPGHTTFLISSGNEQLLIWGDTVHVPEVQTARPEVCMEFDTDADAAAGEDDLGDEAVPPQQQDAQLRVVDDTARRRPRHPHDVVLEALAAGDLHVDHA